MEELEPRGKQLWGSRSREERWMHRTRLIRTVQNGGDSRLAGTQTTPGVGLHTRTAPAAKVRKGISCPCIPAALTVSHRGAQQRPTALRGAEPTQAPTPGTPRPTCIPLDSRPTKRSLFGSGRRRRARITQRRRSFIDVSMATTFPYPPFF